MPKRLLITGSSGFVGTAILRQAANRGYIIRAFTRFGAAHPGAIEYVRGDILDPSAVREAMQGVDCVIHAAGLAHQFSTSVESERHLDEVNHQGALNIAAAAAAKGVSDYLLVSSVSVYGRSEMVRNERARCRPADSYGFSKWRGERATVRAAATARMRLTILRFATVYGEGDPGNVARLIRAIDRGRFAWLGHGANRKSLIYREDAAAACLLALERPDSPETIFNVTGTVVTMNEIVTTIAKTLGTTVPWVRIPSAVGHACSAIGRAAGTRSRRISGWTSSIEKWLTNDEYDGRLIRGETGFHPRVTLAEGIAREVKWLRTADAGIGRLPP